jgi:hypothetical protein
MSRRIEVEDCVVVIGEQNTVFPVGEAEVQFTKKYIERRLSTALAVVFSMWNEKEKGRYSRVQNWRWWL